MILGGRRRTGRLQAALLAQDRAVQLLQVATRLDSELVDENPAALAVRLQRLRLPPGAIEGEHVLAAQPLAHRILLDEALELADQLRMDAAQG